MRKLALDDEITIKYNRNGKESEIKVKLEKNSN